MNENTYLEHLLLRLLLVYTIFYLKLQWQSRICTRRSLSRLCVCILAQAVSLSREVSLRVSTRTNTAYHKRPQHQRICNRSHYRLTAVPLAAPQSVYVRYIHRSLCAGVQPTRRRPEKPPRVAIHARGTKVCMFVHTSIAVCW